MADLKHTLEYPTSIWETSPDKINDSDLGKAFNEDINKVFLKQPLWPRT